MGSTSTLIRQVDGATGGGVIVPVGCGIGVVGKGPGDEATEVGAGAGETVLLGSAPEAPGTLGTGLRMYGLRAAPACAPPELDIDDGEDEAPREAAAVPPLSEGGGMAGRDM